jgi:hypothetical protein
MLARLGPAQPLAVGLGRVLAVSPAQAQPAVRRAPEYS